MSSLLCLRRLPPSTLFPYTTLFRSHFDHVIDLVGVDYVGIGSDYDGVGDSLPTGLKDVASYPNLVYKLLERGLDRKSTRLNSSHVAISYAVFCLKKKKNTRQQPHST